MNVKTGIQWKDYQSSRPGQAKQHLTVSLSLWSYTIASFIQTLFKQIVLYIQLLLSCYVHCINA